MAFIAKLSRRTFLTLSAVGLFGLAGIAGAAPVAGRDYEVVNPAQPTDTPGKIEVTEFFSYACPHCKELEPLFETWMKRQPKDVVIRRVPVTFGRDQWVALGKMYYALDVLGMGERMTPLVFRAIHNENRNLADETVQFDWMASQGIDRKKYMNAYNSFSVQSKMQRAMQLAAAYRISGVPTVSVDGKYETSPSMTEDFNAFFATLDSLVAKARAEKGRR